VCQTPAKAPDTLLALLTEVRQLRQDIEAVTLASQRVQIALYSLQMQDAAVARATRRADDARNKCAATTADRDHSTGEIQRLETVLASGTLPADQVMEIRSDQAQVKSQVELQTEAVQTCQAAEADAASQLRNDQAKLADLHDRIERLDKTLEKFGVAEK